MNQKYALLIGINYYEHPDNKLTGCINDVKMMRSYLIQNRGYLSENILVLRDDDNTFENPHRNAILNNLNLLIEKANLNNAPEIFFHFSGHGTFQKDKNSDEIDKRDELIVPSDFKMIVDDEIKNIFNKLNSNTVLNCIMDCCNSGTNIDLPYVYNTNKLNKNLILEQDNSIKYQTMLNKKIYAISGCKDTQTSADAANVYKVYNDSNPKFSIEKSNLHGGALTSILLELLKTGKYDISTILYQLQTNLIKKRFTQIPLLSSTLKLITKASSTTNSIIKPIKQGRSQIKKNIKIKNIVKISIKQNKFTNSFIKKNKNTKY